MLLCTEVLAGSQIKWWYSADDAGLLQLTVAAQ